MSDTTDQAFARALISSGPMEHNPQRMQLFGRLVGSWTADVRLLDEASGVWSESVNEWIFAYTLGGRAVQDVLVIRDETDPRALGAAGRQSASTTPRWARGGSAGSARRRATSAPS